MTRPPEATVLDTVGQTLQRALAGRFSLERELGRGGMGIVYLARDVRLERPVAIKLLAPELAARPDMRRRFLSEARAAARCFHPHIVPVHAVEEQGDLAWLVMAWVRGESLARRLRRDGPLATPEVRRLAREMGWALAYAHERGVVHRDVKPDNILVEDVSGRFLLTDFGIARLGDDAHTPVDGVLGTARYMAPEQALGEPVDGRADLYALGITLHVAATGRAPFDGDAPAALLVQHATHAPPPIATRTPRLSPALAQAIDRCLAKTPNDRFASAELFLAAIALDDTQETATAPHLRPVRRHLTEAATVLGWAGVVYATGMLVAFADGTGIGASITRSVVSSLATLMGGFAGIRGGQALHAARRALRLGHSPDELNAALAPSDLATDTSLRSATTWLGAGALLALANPTLTNVDFARLLERLAEAIGVPLGVGAAVEALVGLSITIAPLLCLAKGGATLIARWRPTLERPLLAPARRLFTRLAAWRVPVHDARVLPSSDRTELRLDRDVAAAIAALAPARRAEFADVPALARDLAAQVGTLRAEVAHLESDMAEAAPDSAAHALLQAAHAERLERLHTAIAALEQLRLDILALPSESATGTLTSHIHRAHDIARRVSAQLDVERLLTRTPTPT
jgi:eukaryotic-like serine/threonine-protein kinase